MKYDMSYELAQLGCGAHREVYRFLGAHLGSGTPSGTTTFRIWAPNACGVSVLGDFNGWQLGLHPMASLGSSGV